MIDDVEVKILAQRDFVPRVINRFNGTYFKAMHKIIITGNGEILTMYVKNSSIDMAKEKARAAWRVLSDPKSLIILNEEGDKIFEHLNRM